MKLFFKKEEKPIKELIKIFKKDKKPIACKYIHNNNCIIYAIQDSLKTAYIFLKIFLVFFLIKIIKNPKKYNSLKKLLIASFQYLKNPILYGSSFTFIFKISICFRKKYDFLITPYFNLFFSFLICTAVGFETKKKQKDLSAYTFGFTLNSITKHIIDKFFVNKKLCLDNFNKFLYCFTFGLLIQCFNFENEFVGKSFLRHLRRLFPSIYK